MFGCCSQQNWWTQLVSLAPHRTSRHLLSPVASSSDIWSCPPPQVLSASQSHYYAVPISYARSLLRCLAMDLLKHNTNISLTFLSLCMYKAVPVCKQNYTQWNFWTMDTLGLANFGIILLLKRSSPFTLYYCGPLGTTELERLNKLCPLFGVSFTRSTHCIF